MWFHDFFFQKNFSIKTMISHSGPWQSLYIQNLSNCCSQSISRILWILFLADFFAIWPKTPSYIATAKVYTMPPWWPELMRVRKFFPDKIAVCSYLLLSVTTTVDQMAKTRQKLDPKIREIDWSYLRLEQFDKFWICITRRDRKRKRFELVEFCRKKLVKPLLLHLFSAYFSLLEPSTNSWCTDATPK